MNLDICGKEHICQMIFYGGHYFITIFIKTNADIYYYSTIEMDARRFANSLGKKDDDIIFKLLPTCDLDIAYNEGRLLSLQASVYSYLQAHGDDLS